MSISLARDIYWERPVGNESSEVMKNQEGAWAVGLIEQGTLLYMESNEIPPSMSRTMIQSKANCQLVELKDPEEHEGCQWALEAVQDIQESELFVVGLKL